jgi:hypothetical protein
VERHVKTTQQHLRKVYSPHYWDWFKRLPIFLLAYRASTHDTTAVTLACMVFGWDLRLHYELMFGAPADKELSAACYTAVLVDQLHNNHHIARQHLKIATDRMKARSDELANLAVYQESDSEAVPFYPEERKVIEAAVLLGGCL